LRYLPTTIQTSIPFHVANFKFLTDNHPDISRTDRNENREPDRLSGELWKDQQGGFEGVASIPASTKQKNETGLGEGRAGNGPLGTALTLNLPEVS